MHTNNIITVTEGVVLAAGMSSRMGTDKLDLSIKGKKILELCIESMYDFCSRIIVVGGCNYDNTKITVKPYNKVCLIKNQNYKDGMMSSVLLAISHLEGDRFLLVPGDYPLVSKETYKKLFLCEGKIIVPTFCGKCGHPILMNSKVAKDLLNNTSYTTLREYIYSIGFETVQTEDPGILMDVDTPEDYYNILKAVSVE